MNVDLESHHSQVKIWNCNIEHDFFFFLDADAKEQEIQDKF